MPYELTHLIFTYLDTKSFLTSPMICSEFLKIYRFKSTSKLFKQHCYYQWPSEVFSGSLNYLKTFKNWKDMLMKRPLIREDGLYICKMMYKRQGLSDRSAYNPVFEVTSYKYMRFQRDGTVLQIYTNQMPQKFLSQLMPILQGQTNVLSLGQDFGKASKYQEKVELSISRGTYHVWNDLITVDKHTLATEYREQYRIVRQNNLPVYAQKHLKSDYMELEWFGYKLEEDLNNINDDIQIEQQQLLGQDRLHQGYLPLKVNNHNPNQFKFKKMDELA
eukprot:403366752